MSKREFLDTLRAQLEGDLSPSEIEGHLHYYNEYISEAAASGRTEQEVLDELGNPVFIAKTLVDAAESSTEPYGRSSESYGRSAGAQESSGEETGGFFEKKIRTVHIPPFVMKWIVPAVAILLVFLALSLLGSVVMLVARFIVPILVVVIVIALFKSHGGD